MKIMNKVWLVIFLLVLLTLGTGFANSLVYETGTGSLIGFRLDQNHSSNNPEVSPSSIPYYMYVNNLSNTAGHLGVYVYQGDPVTLTVSQLSPIPTDISDPRFFFTRIGFYGEQDGSSWKEYFLAFRMYGQRHDLSSEDLLGMNILVEESGDQVTITQGSGTETVAVNEQGYDESGVLGTYDGSNGFIYRYPYRYIYLEVTAVRTTREYALGSLFVEYYYSSTIQITGNGVSNSLSYEGEVRSLGWWTGTNPDSFSFGIERVAPEYIPFTDLINKTTLSNSYLAGYVSYNSPDTSGTVGFYSDSGGTGTDFTFYSTVSGIPVTIPYHVIFDPVISGNTSSPSIVSQANNSFSTEYRKVSSVINNSQNRENILTGDIRIILNPGLSAVSFPAATYSSTIYAIFTAD
ncbi:MAG: hypothetical protein JXK93_00430 [Sphaerochaetaceae bacterium]|nr:hypothetical protein [Sphaerochaetaceae bacterium]